MAIVIKEIVVKTTVEGEKKESVLPVLPEVLIEQLKGEILKEVFRKKGIDTHKKER